MALNVFSRHFRFVMRDTHLYYARPFSTVVCQQFPKSQLFVRNFSNESPSLKQVCFGSFCLLPKAKKIKQVGLRYISHSSPVCKVFHVTNDNDFMEKVMNSDVPVIVNFHAEWCDPCKILTPQLQDIVEKTEGLDLAIIDVEHNVELVHTFEVMAVPAVLAIKHGRVIDKFIGLQDADQIQNLVAKVASMAKSTENEKK